jgi:phosphoribosyl 1,2-cyclic phosphodiesterase
MGNAHAARDGLTVTFHGVRGSTPCHGSDIVAFGGNTSCVSVEAPDHDPVLLDLGTGLRYFGRSCPTGEPFRGTCLLSHLHWDHIQGLPFFTPLLCEGAEMLVVAPRQLDGDTVAGVFGETFRPPLFPLHLSMLPGTVSFEEVDDTELAIGEFKVMTRLIPHVGNTCGYRLTFDGISVAYLSDHQMPADGSFRATEGAMALCRDADLVIHDAQYTADEFERMRDWGHCTVDYAVWLAAEAGARRLAMFHHDPSHDDHMLEALEQHAIACGRPLGVEVFAAREGQRLVLGS